VHDERAGVGRRRQRRQEPVGADGEAVALVGADEVVGRVGGVGGEGRVAGGRRGGDEREALLVAGGDEGADLGEGGVEAADRPRLELAVDWSACPRERVRGGGGGRTTSARLA
jgi:hypothetical protein